MSKRDEDYYLRAVGKKKQKKQKRNKTKRKHKTNRKNKTNRKYNKKIVDIPFSKYKTKGTRATLGKVNFHYQKYVNIKNFFSFLNIDVNYDNPILHLFARNNVVNYVSIPDLRFDDKLNIVIINLNTSEENHANIALVNNMNNTIEYYEPHGYRRNRNSEIVKVNNTYMRLPRRDDFFFFLKRFLSLILVSCVVVVVVALLSSWRILILILGTIFS